MTATSAWAVLNSGGHILVNTVRSNRTASIEAFMANDTTRSWESWRRSTGVRLIPVTISPEKPA